MENNKLLIGAQFVDYQSSKNANDGVPANRREYEIELYVLRDITFRQLLEGIRYGLRKMVKAEKEKKSEYAEIYQRCSDIFERCVPDETDGKQSSGQDSTCYRNVTLAYYGGRADRRQPPTDEPYQFYECDRETPLCDLGFVTSTRVIFAVGGLFPSEYTHSLKTENIVDAFVPKLPILVQEKEKKRDTVQNHRHISFPQFNISSRELYRFDTEPVEIIPPQAPPKKPRQNLLAMLLPPLTSLVVMLAVRTFITSYMSSGSSYGLQMGLLSAAMGLTAIISAVFLWRRQNTEYKEELFHWRSSYENYIKKLMREIRDRQDRDTKKLDELYPDMLTLIEPDSRGIYSMNRSVFSRAPQDEDFLSFRVGLSDQVETLFEIKGAEQDTVYSEADFLLVKGNLKSPKKELSESQDIIQLYLHSEGKEHEKELEKIHRLPKVIARRYRYLRDAPLLYSLKNRGAVGVVEHSLESSIARHVSAANYFITRMIFELCYYHSPENLQFVILFNRTSIPAEIEALTLPYKFMPHFRGLFPDRSQFVCDESSANLILSGLLTIMTGRETSGENCPHIVVVVYDEYSLRKHAFAKFLPTPPEQGKSYENKLGLTFVYVTRHQEYLPPYCDGVFRFEAEEAPGSGRTVEKRSLTPRENNAKRQDFWYPVWDKARAGNRLHHYWTEMATQKTVQAFRHFSTVYYTRIAENGNVPSSVTLYDLLFSQSKLASPSERMSRIKTEIETNWGLTGQKRRLNVTESLRVPIGLTESTRTFLDLHEKKDGPHMLVAGTTGSGKTETIISYLLGLCFLYRPDELNLLLVDMKGGGFTKRIGRLPHVVGSVTDVDGDETGSSAEYMLRRFLNAMQCEIARRKRLFNNLHVDSIDGYIAACRDIENHIRRVIEEQAIPGDDAKTEATRMRETAREKPLSHIMLIVDEFTELKRFTTENNDIDFIGEITTIARIGRSLGFHIILISQNIEGAITDDIRVNSKSRLCLKVATRQASKEMLGTVVAASPEMPGNGRAYLLVGTGDRLEYFQSGYSGASASGEGEVPVEITLASKCGAYSNFYQSRKDNEKQIQKSKQTNQTKQLDEILRAVTEVYQAHKYVDSEGSTSPDDAAGGGIHKPHNVFRLPLPDKMILHNGKMIGIRSGKEEELPWEEDEDCPKGSMRIPMGVYDAPLEQKQAVFYLNPLGSNAIVFGSVGSGKTTFVKSLLARIHEQDFTKRPEELIYIIDFGGNLGDYGRLPHVCACFNNSGEEDIKRVFLEVENRLEENTRKLRSDRYEARLENAPAHCPPHILLIVENLNSFLADERYSLYQDQLLRFCRDGLSKGLTVLLTASNTSGVSRFLTYFGQKIAMEMPADSCYEIFGVKTPAPLPGAGRGLASIKSSKGTGQYEFQCFLPAGEEDEEESFRRWSLQTSAKLAQYRMEAFDEILTPETADEAMKRAKETATKRDRTTEESAVCVGLDYEKHMPVMVNIHERRAIAVYGKAHFGKTNLLRLILDGVLRIHPNARFVLLDSGRGDLTEKYLPEFYQAKPDYVHFSNDLLGFWEYLRDNGYWDGGKLEDSSRITSSSPYNSAEENLYDASLFENSSYVPPEQKDTSTVETREPSKEPEHKNPFTVFVLQSRKIYQGANFRGLMTGWFPEAVANADKKGYLLLFTDVPPISDMDYRDVLRENLTLAFLLDNIGEFVTDRGNKSVFGEMDAKELKSRYARCALGDGYCYDLLESSLKKVKFIKMPDGEDDPA